MSIPMPAPCPAWCERDHADVYGAGHRAEIGHLDIQGQRLTVAVVQVFGGVASVVLSGAAFLNIDECATKDARGLLTLLGFPFLAHLIEHGEFIVERFNSEARRAASRAEEARL